ncbi:hypothetical protein GA830_12245 [Mesorhizobium sp. NBSH29]|uniref:hypothetical protein n=1 Tax=Mesorhizobium sp. NBSH29 TaxID=2654249 RepID=UPI0018968D22|nr:hypothetical protein [Mesorhizobium sp. NBSH29]QPC87428.1 hypothetical protein GA830_12245 [Mesorhizobium sp. NBSH29]
MPENADVSSRTVSIDPMAAAIEHGAAVDFYRGRCMILQTEIQMLQRSLEESRKLIEVMEEHIADSERGEVSDA